MLRRFLASVLALPVLFSSAPASEEIANAIQSLKVDSREAAPRALLLLVKQGDKAALESIADFGARTRYPKHVILAGKALAEIDVNKAASWIDRLLRSYKKVPAMQARLAMMAEQVPGQPGFAILTRLAKDRREAVAAVAVRALGARKEEGARSQLEGLLKSKRSQVASAAAFSLSRLPPNDATMELLFTRAQRGRKARIGDACALALTRMEGAGRFGDRAIKVMMASASRDSFHALAKLALRLDYKPDSKLLMAATRSPSDRVREVAYDIIGNKKIEGFGARLLQQATAERNWRNSVAAWLALKRSGIEEVIDGVRSNIAKPSEPGYWAIQCAGANPNPELVDALFTAAIDTRDPVRSELAQRALNAHVEQRAKIRDRFRAIYEKQSTTKRGRLALLGIGNLKQSESFDVLIALLKAEKAKLGKLNILIGLQKLTGHYFEPDPEIWKEWYEIMGGQVTYEPPKLDRSKNRQRVKSIQELGVSPRTEAAVENGLLWLSRHQSANGEWNGSTYHAHCTDGKECQADGGHRDRPLAYTALANLCFQGAGYTHLEGPYSDAIQRGYEFILANQDYDGSHYEKSWTFSYESAVLCQALCDGYMLTGDDWLGHGAQRMIDYLVKVQYPGRTWRYAVRSSETDTSVMSWILLAAISARTAGLDIPEQIFVASEKWMDRASDPVPPGEFEVFHRDAYKPKNTYFVDVSRDKKGKLRHYKIKTWYQPPRLYTPAMSAIGMLTRIWMGWTRAHPFCIGAANQVMSQIPLYNSGLEGDYAFYPYTWYYGSLAA
ncbi:MAG: prenyltransferase/squalene oxidase repeat-containing protein, partial [Planctomycetota bacterium]